MVRKEKKVIERPFHHNKSISKILVLMKMLIKVK
jgi:hypothetical protein